MNILRLIFQNLRKGTVSYKLPHAHECTSEHYRGMIHNDASRCVGCGACAYVCPTGAIEVKRAHEDTNHGLAPPELTALLTALQPLLHLEVRGLMTVPPFADDPETARPYFQHLRRLRDEHIALCPTLTELSMGMSNDFAVAIEEGSTTVRIGTAIFGKRTYA